MFEDECLSQFMQDPKIDIEFLPKFVTDDKSKIIFFHFITRIVRDVITNPDLPSARGFPGKTTRASEENIYDGLKMNDSILKSTNNIIIMEHYDSLMNNKLIFYSTKSR